MRSKDLFVSQGFTDGEPGGIHGRHDTRQDGEYRHDPHPKQEAVGIEREVRVCTEEGYADDCPQPLADGKGQQAA